MGRVNKIKMFQYGNSIVKFNCANDKDEEKNAFTPQC